MSPATSDDRRPTDAQPDDATPDAPARGGADPDGEVAADHDRPASERTAPHALVATGDGPGSHLPPPPPRRTGVFLDAEDLREHVSRLLRTTLGGHEVDAFGNITFTHDDARVFITVTGSPVGPQVGVFSVTNLEVPLTLELAGFLLTTNHTLGFGAFSYEPRHGAVWLRHTLLGSTLDLPELQTAVVAIATTAARLDHVIRDRFGGRTFQESPSELQRRVEPPETEGDGPPTGARGYL